MAEERELTNLEKHAEFELRKAGWFDTDSAYNGMLGPATMRLIHEFAQEGHSGYSAGLAIDLFEQVAKFEPLLPLTGEDDEWNEIGEGTYQNKRCSHVFKDANGSAYDSTGIVFKNKSGGAYTGLGSRVPITFPYVPKRVYVEVDE